MRTTLGTASLLLAWAVWGGAAHAAPRLEQWAEAVTAAERWKLEGHPDRAEETLRGVLAEAGEDAVPAAVRGRVYHDLGSLCQDRFARGEALAAYKKAMAAWEQAGVRYRLHLASTLHNMGSLFWEEGRLSEAVRLLERSAELHAAGGDGRNGEIGRILYSLGAAELVVGREVEAAEAFQRLLGLPEEQRREGNRLLSAAASAVILGMLTEKEGRAEEARLYHAQGLRLWAEWEERGRGDERLDICVMTDLAVGLWKQDARKEAVAVVERLVAALEAGRPAADARWIPALRAAARILRKEHRRGEARELERRAGEMEKANRADLVASAHRVDLAALRREGR